MESEYEFFGASLAKTWIRGMGSIAEDEFTKVSVFERSLNPPAEMILGRKRFKCGEQESTSGTRQHGMPSLD
jgi:hypothetical protein